MGDDLYELPEGWVWTDFDNIITFLTDYQSNGSFATLRQNVTYYNQENYAILIRLKDLRNNLEKTENFIYTDKHGYEFLKKSSLYGNEIVVANVGAGVGTTLIVPKINRLATLAPNMFLVNLSEFIYKKYFLNYCNYLLYWREIEKVSGGSGQPKINKKQYRSIIIPLPPLPEQHRIVAKIEELFTQLDAGVELLKKLKTKLKRYRQAVLKAAVEGNLTKEWREANKSELEPASVLLERILKQRREKWEVEQLAKMKAKGKTPKDDRWKSKYKEPVAPDTSDLPELPDGWCWATVEQFCFLDVGFAFKSSDFVMEGIRLLRGENIEPGRLRWNDTRYWDIKKLNPYKNLLLGVIFRKSQNKIQDPAKLKRLVELINSETWIGLDIDVKGEIYEGLLQKNAEDVKGGAGQYFTPRPLIKAIVEVMQPKPGQRICDPACGTGGFFLVTYSFITQAQKLDKAQNKFLKNQTFKGFDVADGVVRLCAMNLYLHGIAGDESPVEAKDSLMADPGERFELVLTNPPFGKKSSVTVFNKDGKTEKEKIVYRRDDFWATTSNKQLNFLQHVKTLLAINGKAAVVVPDNVLFEGGAGETIRKKLLQECDVHTLLRLPTGIFYAQGVKANVLFFDRKPANADPWTKKLWIYDFRTNQHFTLKTNPLRYENLQDFIQCFNSENPEQRQETERFRAFNYEDLIQRDKISLDIFWLKDESLEDSENLPAPDVLALEIAEDLEAALELFQGITENLEAKSEIN